MEPLVTDTLSIYTVAIAIAVIEACQLTAVSTLKAIKAHTLAIHTISMSRAVFWTRLYTAVIPSIPFVT